MYVQHTTDAKTLRQEALGLDFIKDTKSKGTRELSKCKILTKRTKLQKQRYIKKNKQNKVFS